MLKQLKQPKQKQKAINNTTNKKKSYWIVTVETKLKVKNLKLRDKNSQFRLNDIDEALYNKTTETNGV